jgi:outer membrane protein
MKNIMNMLLFTGLFAGAALESTAQTKMGYINRQAVVDSLPAYDSAMVTLQRAAEYYDQTLADNQEEYQKLGAQYQDMAQNPATPKTRLELKIKEIQALEERMREIQEKRQEELQQMQYDLLKPISDAVNRMTETVAKERGYAYVFDNTNQTLVVMPKTDDLTDTVRARMIAEAKKPAPKPAAGK